jgi:hypothetical protein
MRAEFAAAAEARKRAGEDEEGAAPSKRSKGEPLGDAVLEVLNQVRDSSPLCTHSIIFATTAKGSARHACTSCTYMYLQV